MFIRCRGGHDTVLSKILYRRHPLGPVVSMWPPTGAEKARQEIKEARGFVCAPLPAPNTTTSPHNLPSLPPSLPPVTHTWTPLPFFLITVSTEGKEDKILLTNGLKNVPNSQTPFSLEGNHSLNLFSVPPLRTAFSRSYSAL